MTKRFCHVRLVLLRIYMAFSSKKPSLNKIFLLVFGIAFGLVGLALAFQGAKTASDLRSRAAQTNQIYKQWEFNGRTAEGWVAVAPYTDYVQSGFYVVSGGKTSVLPAFRNTNVATSLPTGLKSISLSLAVGPVRIPKPTPIRCSPPPSCPGPMIQLMIGDERGCPVYRCGGTVGIDDVQGGGAAVGAPNVRGVSDQSDDANFQRSVGAKVACTMEARACPDGTYVGRAGNSCAFTACPGKGQRQRKFVAHVYYKLAGRDKYERPVQISGVADGSFATYTVNLTNAESIALDSIRVVFASGVKNADMIAVDWIRILGPVVKPTASPSCIPVPTCDTSRPCPQYYPRGGFCVTPAPTCTPAPPGCVDKNGNISLCDPKPGVVWCRPKPMPLPSSGTGCVTVCQGNVCRVDCKPGV